MQLIIATLSSTAISYVIGCVSSHDMWIQLKDRFSTITKARIFQMKSELQTIKKGSDTVSQYLQKIKDARDHLSAAVVYFEDDDIVILALNGLPSDYNTFRCMVRGRDNVLSLEDFRSQLLGEEATLEQTYSAASFVSAMMAQHQASPGKALALDEGNSHSHSHPSLSKSAPPPGFHGGFNGHNSGFHGSNGGYFGNRGSHFKGGGRGRHQYHFSPRPYQVPPTSNPGILGPGIDIPTCQICTKKGHVAADCYQRHTMHAAFPPPSPPEQFWVDDTSATTHMTSNLAQLNLAAPFSGADIVTTAGGSSLTISNIGSSILDVPHCSLQLKQVLHMPKLSQHLLLVHKLCKDNNCRFICDAFGFWIQDKITRNVLLKGLCRAGLYPIPFSFAFPSQSLFTNNLVCYLGKQVNTSL
jgi:hypothetical protein